MAGGFLIGGATAPSASRPKKNEGSKNWYWLGVLIALFTTVNYGFTSAAYARRAFETPEEQWGWGAYYVACAVLANVFFDLMAAREDIGQPLEEYYGARIKPFVTASRSDQATTIAQLFAALIVGYCAFNTSFTTKIPGQEGIEAFDDVLHPGLSTILQIINSIYAGVFVTMLFSSGTFQLPGLIKDSIIWKKEQSNLEKVLLTFTLLTGLVVGVGAYLVFLNTLWNFPENKSAFRDPSNDYLKTVIRTWKGFATIFPLTRGAFCILFAQRGAKELLEQLYALFTTGVKEAPLRVSILMLVGAIAYGSIAPSIFQATTPLPHQIGHQWVLRDLIIACAFFVNCLGMAKRMRVAFERKEDVLGQELSIESGARGGEITVPLLLSVNEDAPSAPISRSYLSGLTPLKDVLHSDPARESSSDATAEDTAPKPNTGSIFCCFRKRMEGAATALAAT